MVRTILASACLAAALALAVGCSGQSGGGGQPRLANPDDSRVKNLQPAGVGAPGGAGGAKPNPQ
jgi:hypothetical protein